MAISAQLEDGVTGDADLIVAARSGDAVSVGALYERHAGAAWVVARQYTDSPADADDVVADSFAAVFGALQRGKGPEVAFRAYLFTVVRRVAAVRREKARRVQPTDDVAVLEQGTAWAGAAEEPVLAGFERGVVARAFHSLPERWQAVLWHTEVEGLTPAEIAPILGLTANGVAALSYRAREGLRQAYLQEHLQDPLEDGCRAVSGKLGAYVRGGLGTRETAQVESHLETCGTCRGLVLELGDVNHGMRAVIAPLVLGLVGLGALGVLLPVGGGIAAGIAAAGAGGAVSGGGAGAASSGGAGAGATAAGTGAVAGADVVAAGAGGAGTPATTGAAAGAAAGTAAAGAAGAGAAGAGAAAAGGFAAFVAAIPLGAAAIVVGGLALAAVAVVGIVALLNGPDGGTPVSAPTSSSSASPGTTAPGTTTPGTTTPNPAAPGAVPNTPAPSPGASAAAPATSGTASVPAAGGASSNSGTTTPTGTVPAVVQPAPTETTPVVVPPSPANVALDLPAGGLALEAGLGGQELSLGVRNTGGTAATALVAQVTLPAGVTLDGISSQAFAGVSPGRFAVAAASGWVCTDAPSGGTVQCTLATLAPMTTSTLGLRVSVDDVLDRLEGSVDLVVQGVGITFHAPPITVKIAASPARLALRTPALALQLVSGRTRTLVLDVANVGGSLLATGAGVVTIALPAGVTGALAADGTSPWSCTTEARAGATVLSCRIDSLGGRAAAALPLALTAGPVDTVGTHQLSILLAPGGRLAPSVVTAPFTVVRPAALAVTGAPTVDVALGRTTTAGLAVTNAGDLPATGVTVALTVPAGVTAAVSDDAWTCTDGATLTCTLAHLDPGVTVPLPVSLAPLAGSVGPLGVLGASVAAPDADAAQALNVAVTSVAPVLALATGDPTILLNDSGVGTVRFTVSVVGGDTGADADAVRATLNLPANLRYDPAGGAQSQGCVASTPRTVVCDLGRVSAGSAPQVLVNVRWAGSARGTAVVQADATGASRVRSSSTVTTSSAGLSPRVRLDGGWAVTEVGAPLLSCNTSQSVCRSALAKGDGDNNGLDMIALDGAPPATGKRASVPVSSSTTLSVPEGRTIAFAGLYWSGDAGPGDTWSGPQQTARLRGPKGDYADISGAVLSAPTDNADRRYYQSFADVTTQVAAGGAGTWSVADVAVSTTRKDSNRTYYAGWSLVVVYSDPGSDATVTVYDGGSWIGTSKAAVPFEFASEAGTAARIGVVAWEGDRTGTGDRLLLGDTCTSSTSVAATQHALVPQRWGGAGFIGGGVATNAFDSTATGWRATNSLGTDAKGFAELSLACDVSSLTATTSGDQYLIGAITVRTAPAAAPSTGR